MKKIFLPAILVLFFCQFVFSQTVRNGIVTGTVVDADDNVPMIGAYVIVDSTSQITTDVQGNFRLNNIRTDKEVEVEISFLGYQTFFRNVIIDTLTNLGTIRLNKSDFLLEEAEIIAEAPMMIQKGDTLQFNASAFKTNPDADGSDLVNKMPGMEVSDGTIKAQGETVSRVYVDGKLTFGDDAMTALQTLPADFIESIQMFDELSDESRFLGINDGRTNRVLNVVTKSRNVKTAITARIEAGYGGELEKNMDGDFQSRYTVNGETNIFTEKNRWTVGLNMNNVNNSGGRGGYRGFGGGGGGNTTLHSGNLNYSKDWSDDLKLNTSYTLRHNDNETIRRSIQNFFPNEQFNERVVSDSTWSTTESYTHNVNARLEYTMNANNRFMFMPNFTYTTSDSWSRNHTVTNTSWLDGSSTYSESNTVNDSDNKNYNVGGNLMWLRRLGSNGRAISTSFSGRASENDANHFQLDTTEVSTNPMNKYIVSWNRSRTAGVRLNYSEPLSEASRININYNISYEKSKAYKMVYDWLTGKEVVDEQLSNIYTRNYTTNNAGVGYTYNKNNLTINANLNYEHSKRNRDQEFPDPPLDFQPSQYYDNILPTINLRFIKDRSKTLMFTYNTRVSLPSIEQLYSVIDDSNPIQLTSGNPNLKESYTHNIRLMYRTSNVEKSSVFYVNLNANAIQNNIANKTHYFERDTVLSNYGNYEAEAGAQLRTPENVNGYYSLNSSVGYGFPVKVLRTNIDLTGSYNFTRSPSYTRDVLNHSNSNNMGFNIKLSSNISQNVDFTVSSDSRYQYATNSANANTKFFQESVSGSVSIIFFGGFTFTSDVSYRYTHNMSTTGYTQRYTLWNAGIGRKFFQRKNGEVRITMYDILKQNTSLSHNMNDTYISDTWSNTIGRYLMLTFTYRFNTLNQQSGRGNGEREGFREGGFSGGERGPGGFGAGGRPGGPGGGFGGGM